MCISNKQSREEKIRRGYFGAYLILSLSSLFRSFTLIVIKELYASVNIKQTKNIIIRLLENEVDDYFLGIQSIQYLNVVLAFLRWDLFSELSFLREKRLPINYIPS